MRYRDLKQERDDAIARAVAAERLSMKSEFDRVTAEFEKEKERLLAQAARNVKDAYYRGFLNGKDVMADSVSECLARRTAIPFMSDRPDLYPTLGHP